MLRSFFVAALAVAFVAPAFASPDLKPIKRVEPEYPAEAVQEALAGLPMR